MSTLIPSRIGPNWWDVMDYSSGGWDRRLGTGLFDSESNSSVFHRGYTMRPRIQDIQSTGRSEVLNNKAKFQVKLDVSHFNLGDLEVKVEDDYIVIHGEHEEKIDEYGLIKRVFTRRYALPEGTQPETIKASWDQHDILTIHAPKKEVEPPKSREIVVPISVLDSASGDEKKMELI